MTVAYISHSDCGRHDTGWNHPEHVGRLRAIPRALRNDFELFDTVEHREGRHATVAEIALAHDAAYIERVRVMAESGGGRIEADTVISEGSWDAALAGAGSVLDGIDWAFDGSVVRSFCAVRPPGHHALRAASMGFCLFGNIGIGAQYARHKHNIDRVLIVDWDVHHGNGTQDLVQHDAGTRFISMHQSPWYPGTGDASDRGPHQNIWNVPMAGSLPPMTYVDAITAAVDAATDNWRPDLVLVSAGFDCLAGDPLGEFTLELEHVEHLTRMLVTRAETWCGGRLVSALEGGYDPERLGAACVTHLRALR
jgi:acetoin utilization deacetylase AcuC-like enzyme